MLSLAASFLISRFLHTPFTSGYPNGKSGIAAVCVAVVGFIMAIPATFGCRYFKQQISSTSYFYFGLFSYQQSDGVCVYWDESSNYTSAWMFARAMAILATLCGTIALSFTLSISCVSMPNLVLKITSVAYLVAGVCIILTLVAFANCSDCSLAGSGYMAIIAPIVYFITAVIIFKIPPYESDGDMPVATKGVSSSSTKEDVTITITELPDGTRKTVKTTIDKHGNKTVEETLEPPEEEEEDDVETTYLPDGSIMTRRITYDEDGNKVIHETIEKAPQA